MEVIILEEFYLNRDGGVDVSGSIHFSFQIFISVEKRVLKTTLECHLLYILLMRMHWNWREKAKGSKLGKEDEDYAPKVPRRGKGPRIVNKVKWTQWN